MNDPNPSEFESDAAEQAFDAMLVEALSDAKPPDLSEQILSRLHDSPPTTPPMFAPPRVAQDSSVKPPRKSSASRSTMYAVIAGLAASAMIIVALRSNREIDGTPIGPVAQENETPENDNSLHPSQPKVNPSNAELAQDSSDDQPGGELAVAEPIQRKRNPGVPLAMAEQLDAPENDQPRTLGDSPGNDSPRNGSPRNDSPLVADAMRSEPAASEQPAAITMVSRTLDQGFQDYWDAIGIEPSPEAETRQIADRLTAMLSVEFSPQDLSDTESVRLRLTDGVVSAALADGWLDRISHGGLGRLDEASRSALVAEFAEAVAGNQPIDELIAKLISGRHRWSSAFITAMSQGSRNPVDGKLAANLAGLTMNVDLRCIRCHDAYIEGSGRQQDYWAFAAFLKRGLRHTNGAWLVQNRLAVEPLFYDLPDGRKRAASSAVATRWMQSPDDKLKSSDDELEAADPIETADPIESMGQWSGRLLDSRALARGVVNSVWELVHGEPLSGRVVDPVSAPHHEALTRLETGLSDDLIRSNFDVGRTMALVIASSPSRRSVPESMQNVWAIRDADDRAAAGAFAAAVPIKTKTSMKRRLDETLRSVGAKLDTDGTTLLAQLNQDPSNSGKSGQSKNSSDDDSLSWDFPGRVDGLPVQWLGRVEDRDLQSTGSRVAHLCYLAGLHEVPPAVQTSVEAMTKANVDEETLLSRVWWMIR